ncbi:hypothetical protein QBC35DRAFT_465997 [Podospora australis]|uniref:Polyketide synthase n=1 Tax=Podospora australis TaxID=1536484 RepID=A0AAN7ADX2_9PEZI|nr:hypothetical protein QBC35DRAFT_465997 [Podospora australis]
MRRPQSIMSDILLFGPQTTNWTPETLSRLQQDISSNQKLRFLANTVEGLLELWPAFQHHSLGFSRLDDGPGRLQHLAGFIRGEITFNLQSASNIQLAPLTVVSQVVDLAHHFNKISAISKQEPLQTLFHSAQGFCIGFLTAAALSSSTTWSEFEQNVSNALRLATCIGAAVDAEDLSHPLHTERSTAICIRLKTQGDRAMLETLLDQLPEAYISCAGDDGTLTITLANGNRSWLTNKLREANIASIDIALRGRYHHKTHELTAAALEYLCERNEHLQLPTADKLLSPLRSTADAQIIPAIPGIGLHGIALDVILCKRAHWVQTVRNIITDLPQGSRTTFVPIGPQKSAIIPQSLTPTATRSEPIPCALGDTLHKNRNHEIAIVGMAARFPQSDSLSELWQLLLSGKTAFSPEIPALRFDPAKINNGGSSRYHGNFLRDADAFDHRFFGISGREAKTMDPQQRLALQVAYEALESAGYFSSSATGTLPEKQIGVYMGVGAVEYEENMAAEDQKNAFSAVGMLRSFISGRISHFFGWSGPALTVDTACSSSAVAIHTACKALLGGECEMALAGGVNVITSPTLHQNLAAGSFLSPNGSSRAFDASAAGYCRGEGGGILVLKPLAKAVADGDAILGVVAASAVNQNSNCSPITVPESSSQSELYSKVLGMAGVSANEVTYVEAHGTGTQVGDPKEYESVRLALGGPSRTSELFLGSIKDNVGHCEAASGVASIIKTLLMMHHETIPKQAGFATINPRIKTSPSDKITIPTRSTPWLASKRIALVNNYGAAGNNAAILLRQYRETSSTASNSFSHAGYPCPIVLSAKSPSHLQSYLQALEAYRPSPKVSFQDFAYNLVKRQNASFPHRIAFTATDFHGFKSALGTALLTSTLAQTKRVVVLAFGGQTTSGGTVSRDLYESSGPFGYYLDRCNDVCNSLSIPSIFPAIFTPNNASDEDIVTTHCRLLAVQISTAQAWIESGVCEPSCLTLIGHSFGQISALVVSGSLSLEDGFRFVAGRAKLIRDAWGSENGAMVSLECEKREAETVAATVNADSDCQNGLQIACYNGTTSIVLSGREKAISRAEEICRLRRVKTTRLSSSHAYHSAMTEPILDRLATLAKTITLQPPQLRIETCTEGKTWEKVTVQNLVQHTRGPVFFRDAVERIATSSQGATWLEAGSASPVIAMARRIVAARPARAQNADAFIPLDLRGQRATSNLAEATCQLWRAGSPVGYWPFHGRNASARYRIVHLPPYQFDKTRHWIEYRPRNSGPVAPYDENKTSQAASQELVTLIKTDATNGQHVFTLNTNTTLFQQATKGHAVAGQALCPASMYLEMAARCASVVSSANLPSIGPPHFEDLMMASPLGLNTTSTVLVTLQDDPGSTSHTVSSWKFTIMSYPSPGTSTKSPLADGNKTIHSTGRLSLPDVSQNTAAFDDKLKLISKVMRPHSRADRIHKQTSSSGVTGPMVYKLFSDVVDYADYYRGVSSISAHENEAVGLVSLSTRKSSLLGADFATAGGAASGCDPVTMDNFLQVAGIHVNCLSPRRKGQVFMCTGVDEVIVSSFFDQSQESDAGQWTVYSRYEQISETEVTNDMVVFDTRSDTNSVVLAVLGAVFKGVALKSVERSLARLNNKELQTPVMRHHPAVIPVADAKETSASDHSPPLTLKTTTTSRGRQQPPLLNVTKTSVPAFSSTLSRVAELLSSIIEMPVDEIKPTSTLDELGVDSLLATEVLGEIYKRFSVTLTQALFQDCRDVASLAKLVDKHLHGNSQPCVDVDGVEDAAHESCCGNESDSGAADSGVDSGVELPSQTSSLSCSPTLSSFNASTPRSESEVLPDSGTIAAQPNLTALSLECFSAAQSSYDAHAETSGFASFCNKVYPFQSQLVTKYVVSAFASLGCDLAEMHEGTEVCLGNFDQRHSKLIPQLYAVLSDAGLIVKSCSDNNGVMTYQRTSKPVGKISAETLHARMLSRFPQHASETKLLHATGSKLAACLQGTSDPVGLIFGDADTRAVLEDVYANAPMFKTGTLVLCEYLSSLMTRLSSQSRRRPIRILELGAGTGGTTKSLLQVLASSLPKIDSGSKIEYTFSDISPSLVAAARRKLSSLYSPSAVQMAFATIDIEKETRPDLLGKFDMILSTNCIHATQNLVNSTTHIREMLVEDGVLCLVELTKNLPWFDLVFGLLEGWWLFSDGRAHALADEKRWEHDLVSAGFGEVSWTTSGSPESRILRVITATAAGKAFYPASQVEVTARREQTPSMKETVCYATVDGIDLLADIYFPAEVPRGKRPIALMIHGGGHIMLSRNDIRPEQTALLLDKGFLPVSIDYRLCPETTLAQGPMADVAKALVWARKTLPSIRLSREDVVADGDKVVAVGWSTGGHLAMSLAWTALERGVRPPEAVLAFYCPSDYEDKFWTQLNIPRGSESLLTEALDWEKLRKEGGVFPAPVTAYNPLAATRAVGGWMTTEDARSRLALQMNHQGKTLSVLVNGIREEEDGDDGDAEVPVLREDIVTISPLAQIRGKRYITPTFMIHPRQDDLIPWEQAERTWRALREEGVDAELRILDGVGHLFDVHRGWKENQEAEGAVLQGYEFLGKFV